MTFLCVLLLTTAFLLTMGFQPASAQTEPPVDLEGYDFVIGDTGERVENWDARETRTYVKVQEDGKEYFFDSLPAAFFVLKEKYGTVRVDVVGVADYSGNPHTSGPSLPLGLVDARDAYFVWDDDRSIRGGLPYVVSYHSRDAAYAAADGRYTRLMDFPDLILALKSWAESSQRRTYWRGRNNWDSDCWDRSWNRRWVDYDWNHHYGWGHRSHFRPRSHVQIDIGHSHHNHRGFHSGHRQRSHRRDHHHH